MAPLADKAVKIEIQTIRFIADTEHEHLVSIFLMPRQNTATTDLPSAVDEVINGVKQLAHHWTQLLLNQPTRVVGSTQNRCRSPLECGCNG